MLVEERYALWEALERYHEAVVQVASLLPCTALPLVLVAANTPLDPPLIRLLPPVDASRSNPAAAFLSLHVNPREPPGEAAQPEQG